MHMQVGNLGNPVRRWETSDHRRRNERRTFNVAQECYLEWCYPAIGFGLGLSGLSVSARRSGTRYHLWHLLFGHDVGIRNVGPHRVESRDGDRFGFRYTRSPVLVQILGALPTSGCWVRDDYSYLCYALLDKPNLPISGLGYGHSNDVLYHRHWAERPALAGLLDIGIRTLANIYGLVVSGCFSWADDGVDEKAARWNGSSFGSKSTTITEVDFSFAAAGNRAVRQNGICGTDGADIQTNYVYNARGEIKSKAM